MQNVELNRKSGLHADPPSKCRHCGFSRLLLPFLFLLTTLAPLECYAADLVVKNGDFSISDRAALDFGWELRGAAYIDAGVLKLPEGGADYAEALQTISIPAGTSTLSFTLTKIKLEANQGNPPDAFVVYLEDPDTGLSLIEPIDANAIFNLQQTGEVYYSPQVTVPGASASGSAWTFTLPAQVMVDVSGITTKDIRARVVFELVGLAGGASHVEIDNFQTMAAPVANNDGPAVNEDTPTLIDVLANDTDLNGSETLNPATVTVVSAPAHGTVAVQADGKILYTPALNYWGADGFTYTVKDNDGNLSNTATVSVTVVAMDDPFSDADEEVATNEDTTLTGNVLTGTSSVDGPVTVKSFTVAGDPASYTAGVTATIAGKGTLTIAGDGAYTFIPVANYNGAVPIVTYTLTDGSGTDDTSTLKITVTSVNDNFADADETVSTEEDTTLTGNVLTGTSSVDGPVTVKGFTVAGDSTTYPAGATATIAGKGELTIGGDGSYTFTPSANYNGAVPVVTYTMTDGSDPGDTSTLTISVTSVNDLPVANAGPDQSIREGTVVTLDGSASTDVDDANLAYSWTQISETPIVTLSDPAAMKPTFTAPSVQAAGGLLTFQLKVTDSGNAESTDTVSIKINNYVIPCDVNDNGVVDLADSVLLLKAMSRLSTADAVMSLAADVNGDGRLNAAELICTLQHAAGLRAIP